VLSKLYFEISSFEAYMIVYIFDKCKIYSVNLFRKLI